MNPYLSGLFCLFGAGCVYLGYRLIVLGSTGVFSYTAGLSGWRLALASTFPGLFFAGVGALIWFAVWKRIFGSSQSRRHEEKRVTSDSLAKAKSRFERAIATTTPRGRGFSLSGILPGKKLGIIALSTLGVAVVAVLLGGILMVGRKVATPSPDNEIKAAVAVINSRLTDVTLSTGHLVFQGAAAPPRAQYRLTLGKEGKDAVYLFKISEYVFETGGSESKIPTAQLCDLVNAVYDRPEPIFESLRQLKVEGKIAFPIWKGISGELQTDVTSILVQTLYALRKFYELQHTYPEILIKGYADGKTKTWSKPFDDRYHFTSIKAFYPTDRSSVSPVEYNRSEEEVPLEANSYSNSHLPDLRAKFVEQVLVVPYLNQCKDVNKPQVHILKGYEFKEPDQPLERKVEITILLRDL